MNFTIRNINFLRKTFLCLCRCRKPCFHSKNVVKFWGSWRMCTGGISTLETSVTCAVRKMYLILLPVNLRESRMSGAKLSISDIHHGRDLPGDTSGHWYLRKWFSVTSPTRLMLSSVQGIVDPFSMATPLESHLFLHDGQGYEVFSFDIGPSSLPLLLLHGPACCREYHVINTFQ